MVGGLLNVTGLVAGFARPFFGTCNTAASTSVKTVTCEGFDRKVGAVIRILMTNTNTASLPQLNINSTGAAYLSYGNARAASGSTQWLAGSILTVVYTGSYYEVLSMAGSWTPTIAGTASYTYQEGYFEYHAGVVSFGFSINGTFSSSTTATTQTVVAGLPFTNAGMGLATGGGIAYGCLSDSVGFFGWCVASGASTITARNASLTTTGSYAASYIYNNPSRGYNISGTITMRVI